MLLWLFVVDVFAHLVVVIVDLEPLPAVRRAVAGLPRLEPGWERLQGHYGYNQQENHGQQGHHNQQGNHNQQDDQD